MSSSPVALSLEVLDHFQAISRWVTARSLNFDHARRDDATRLLCRVRGRCLGEEQAAAVSGSATLISAMTAHAVSRRMVFIRQASDRAGRFPAVTPAMPR